MPRTIYIHIGPMKTGTSALQTILSNGDNSRVIYPKVGLWGPGSHHGLVFSFFGQAWRGKEPHDNCDELFQRIRDETELSNLDLLISSEVLSERRKQGDLARFIDTLLGALGSDLWSIEILLACREHFQRAASAYSQRIKGKASRETRSPDQFLVEDAERFTYAPLVQQAIATGFKVAVLNYHPSETWTSRFLAHVGFFEGQTSDSPKRNISLSPKALIAKLSANRVRLSEKDRVAFVRALRAMPGRYGSSSKIFSEEAMRRAEIHFVADRAFLLENYGIQLPEPEMGTSNMFVLDDEALADIAAAARRLGKIGESIVGVASEYMDVNKFL